MLLFSPLLDQELRGRLKSQETTSQNALYGADNSWEKTGRILFTGDQETFTTLELYLQVIYFIIVAYMRIGLANLSLECTVADAMASAKITVGISPKAPTETTEMLIVGGGICGILAAKNCVDSGIKYRLVEKESCLGGNWHTLANTHSYLQVSTPCSSAEG